MAKACDRGETTREDAAGAILYASEKATQCALDAIQLLGGNVRQASTVIFALGGAIAGLVGAGASPIYSVDPNTGFNFLVPSFVVIVIGGVGSFGGAILGGLVSFPLTVLAALAHDRVR